LNSDTVSYFGSLAGNSDAGQISPGFLTGFLILVILLITSALISGSGVAFFSLKFNDIEEIKKRNPKYPGLLSRLLSKPEHLLSAILVGNTLCNIAIVTLSAYLLNQLLDFYNHPFLLIIYLAALLSILLLFTEIIPRVIAMKNPKKYAVRFSSLIYILTRITQPVNSILVSSTSFLSRRLTKYQKNLSIEDIGKALTDQDEYSDEKGILEGIVKFGNKTVNEIMRPRMAVVSLEIHTSFDEVLEIIRESGYSRIPVYQDTLDDVRGILYIKDLLPHLDKSKVFHWQSLMRQAFFIPESKKIDELLEEFQKSKVHLAVVVDEYGGTSGLVTLEDILEEIVGDIADEFDKENKFFTRIAENEYIFEGNTLLNDFYKTTGTEDTIFDEIKGEAETLAGLILEMTKEMPKVHDKLKYKNFTFEVEEADFRRINKIRVIMVLKE
jgi:putative hemolysin